MPLKMRPTGLGHGVYKDNVDYSVFCGEWCIGRIYDTRTGLEHLRWFCALHFRGRPENLRTDNRGRRGPSWKRCLRRVAPARKSPAEAGPSRDVRHLSNW
jgi:hypothetical protein